MNLLLIHRYHVHHSFIAFDVRDRMKKRQEGEIEEDDAGDDREVMTALDKEDLATEKLKQFQPSPRETSTETQVNWLLASDSAV